MPKVSRKPGQGKPREDFPLYCHRTGRWAKKVRGQIRYFGKIAEDPKGKAALELWLDQKDDLLAGRKPRASAGGVTVADACDNFIVHKEALLQSEEIAQRTWERLYASCEFLCDGLGRRRCVEDLHPDDFAELRKKMATRWGPVALGNEIQNIRSVFRYNFEAGHIDRPVRFGPGFEKPSAKTLRLARAARGSRLLTPAEIHAAVKVAPISAKAMLLLGVNAGLGNTDLALLPLAAIDMKGGWLNYPRPKTGVPRRIPLWPETVAAIKQTLQVRQPQNKQDEKLLFIGRRGQNYIGANRGYRVHAEIARVFRNAKIAGRSFYDMRHTFSTIAEGARDLPAAQAIMGHAASGSDMAARYREGVSDDRLRAVANHVHAWLYKPEPATQAKRRGRARRPSAN